MSRRVFHLVKWVNKASGLIAKGTRIEVRSVEKMKEYLGIGYSIERVEMVETRGEKKREQDKEKSLARDRILF